MLRSIRLSRIRRPAGFTMIELLVVIVVLGLLISLVTAVAAKAIRQQKVRNTQQIMQNVTLALEQFGTENPLRAIYDRKDRETFGKYPPYQLANVTASGSVSAVLEPAHAFSTGSPAVPGRLIDRLARDVSATGAPAVNDWVVIEDPNDGNDDIRALYAYTKVYSPATLRLIPEDRLKPINSQSRDYVNPQGSAGTPGTPGALDWLDILAIHDAWGVPLDYMLYVKCEWGLCRDPLTGIAQQGFRVVERRPVLRSRGIKREVYDAWVQSDPADPTQRETTLSPPDKWLFSEELPRPWARVDDVGVLDDSSGSGQSRANGWVRAVGLNEDYGYQPDADTEAP